MDHGASKDPKLQGVEPLQGAGAPSKHQDVLVVAFAASQAEPEWLGVPWKACLCRITQGPLKSFDK